MPGKIYGFDRPGFGTFAIGDTGLIHSTYAFMTMLNTHHTQALLALGSRRMHTRRHCRSVSLNYISGFIYLFIIAAAR